MGTNNYLPFATGGGANVVTQVEYQGAAWRPPGFPAGASPPIAEPSQVNKILRQASVMSAAWGKAIVDTLVGVDALDDGDVAGLEAKLLLAINTSTFNSGAFAEANMVINPGMEVSQQFGTTSTSVTASGAQQVGAGYVDQWYARFKGTFVGALQQVADAPPGFLNSLKFTVSTAQAVMGFDDRMVLSQPIEGWRLQPYAYGSASAQPLVFAFWVKAHRTGTYTGSIEKFDTAVSYPFSYTVNVADTWEYKSVVIPGETAATWLKNSNYALWINFSIASGTNWLNAAGAWVAASNSGATGQVNGLAATSDVFQITGLGIIPGIQIPLAPSSPMLKRTYDRELVLCRRFFQRWTQPPLMGQIGNVGTTAILAMPLGIQLRTAPSIFLGGVLPMLAANAAVNLTALTANSSTIDTVQLSGTLSAGSTSGFAVMGIQDGDPTHYLSLIAR